MVENAGVKLRLLDTRAIDRFPSNGFLALEETLAHAPQGGGGARAELREGHGVRDRQPRGRRPDPRGRSSRQTKPTGKDEATALRDDAKVLQARAQNWQAREGRRRSAGARTPRRTTSAYADFMLKTGIIKQAVTAKELVTNELIDEINHFDPEKIAAEARAYRAGG